MTQQSSDQITMAWLTAGLLFSAAVQALLQGWAAVIARRAAEDESDRRTKERVAAEVVRNRIAEAEQDAAFLVVWAEAFRVDSLADQWGRADLIELSVFGLLDPLAVKTTDSSTFMRDAAKISHEAGYLCGMATTLASDTALQIAMFNQTIAEAAGRIRQRVQADAATIVSGLRQQHGQELSERAERIRRATRQLALLLNDAALHSPRAEIRRRISFKDDMKSDLGQQAAQTPLKYALGTGARHANEAVASS